jgi:hypothetical protein
MKVYYAVATRDGHGITKVKKSNLDSLGVS